MTIESIIKQASLENSKRLFDYSNLDNLDYLISILENNESLEGLIKEINNLKRNLKLKKERNYSLMIQGFKLIEPKAIEFNKPNEVKIRFFNLDINGKFKSNGYIRITNSIDIRNLFELEDNYKALLMQKDSNYFHLFIFKDTDNIINEEFINKVKLHLTI